MSPQSTEAVLMNQVESQLQVHGDAINLGVDDDLLMHGLDSIGFLRLVEFVEKEFTLEVPAADVTVEQFGTVSRIARYVDARKDAH